MLRVSNYAYRLKIILLLFLSVFLFIITLCIYYLIVESGYNSYEAIIIMSILGYLIYRGYVLYNNFMEINYLEERIENNKNIIRVLKKRLNSYR